MHTVTPTAGNNTYSVEWVKDGCISERVSFSVNIANPLTVSTNNLSICQGQMIDLTQAINEDYSVLSPVFTNQKNEIITDPSNYVADTTETITYLVISNEGCETIVDFELEVTPADQIVIDNITTGNNQNGGYIAIEIKGNKNYNYQLDNGPIQTEPLFENLSSGTYQITVFDPESCMLNAIEVITLLEIPTFITPNGDGINDTWTISIDNSQYDQVQLMVFNKHGELMIDLSPESSDPTPMVWKGTVGGKAVPEDDYWYVLMTKSGGKPSSTVDTLVCNTLRKKQNKHKNKTK